MLAIGPKIRGFKPGRGNEFLRMTQIQSMPSFRADVNLLAPYRNTLQHLKITSKQTWREGKLSFNYEKSAAIFKQLK
jgi:hypothetical protein